VTLLLSLSTGRVLVNYGFLCCLCNFVYLKLLFPCVADIYGIKRLLLLLYFSTHGSHKNPGFWGSATQTVDGKF
jgi:hypothetical protein